MPQVLRARLGVVVSLSQVRTGSLDHFPPATAYCLYGYGPLSLQVV